MILFNLEYQETSVTNQSKDNESRLVFVIGWVLPHYHFFQDLYLIVLVSFLVSLLLLLNQPSLRCEPLDVKHPSVSKILVGLE